jgi:hypothetical protein
MYLSQATLIHRLLEQEFAGIMQGCQRYAFWASASLRGSSFPEQYFSNLKQIKIKLYNIT